MLCVSVEFHRALERESIGCCEEKLDNHPDVQKLLPEESDRVLGRRALTRFGFRV